ncbi:MAG TPA: dephospho-CoA kinase [Burkholderiales bacterium]|nr:dephospho-CoA kinase [Burkholderiales bacterium]
MVAVTGGIGSGKSTVAAMFRKRGAAVVDTDVIAEELTRPGEPALDRIAARFGPEYIAAGGGLDRSKLRRLVFEDARARADLEAILHPLIETRVRERVLASDAPYVLVLIPLFAETGAYRDLVQRVLVVDCDEALQVQRTMQRSGLAADEVRAIMAAQVSRASRLALADDVIRNDDGLKQLAAQVNALDLRYRELVPRN